MGLGLFWKEAGPTSSEFLGDIKRDLIAKNACPPGPLRKGIGHAGTLDPFAEGWLLVGWEEGTKFLSGLRGLTKTYEAEVLVGATSDTFDLTHALRFWAESPKVVSEDELKVFLQNKIGSHSQMPPAYSAKKVDGQPAYKAARRGEEVTLKSADIQILSAEHLYLRTDTFEHDGIPYPVLRWGIRIHVTSGTYIRAFARDWASELWGEPACLSKLTRVAIGQLKVKKAKQLILSKIGDLTPLFEVLRSDDLADLETSQNMTGHPTAKGTLLLGNDGKIAATWVEESARWRHFVSDPLSLETTHGQG